VERQRTGRALHLKMSYTVENNVNESQKKLWLKKKEREKGKREKQMEELKAGRNGSFAQVGWTDGWLGG